MINAHQLANLRNKCVAPEALTFLSKTGQGTFATAAILWRAQRSHVQKEMIEGGKLVQKQSVNFRVFAADFVASSASTPKADDRVVDSNGSTYVIPSVTVEMLGQLYCLNDCQLLPR